MKSPLDTNFSPVEDKMTKSVSDKGALVSLLLVLLGSLIYISLTFNNNVWLDEAFTASLVNTDMRGVLERSMADTLPPLYNILLKLSTDIFGYTVPVMKLTSAVPMILTMILGATVVRKRSGNLTSYIFILAIATMPNMLFYGVEIRMYSLGFLFATAAGIYVYEVICEPTRRNWTIFTLMSVLAGYSHHFAFVAVGFVYLFLLLYIRHNTISRNRSHDGTLSSHKNDITLAGFFKCLLATFVLYFPCLIVTLKQLKSVSGYFSMPDVTLQVFVKYCRYPYTVGFTPLSVLLILTVAALFIRLCVRKTKTVADAFAIFCFLLYYGVLLFGTAVSRLMTANIFVDRYLFFSLGVLWLFFAMEAASLDRRLVFLIIALQVAVGAASYTQARASEYAAGADETMAWLNSNVQQGDSLYTLEDYEELAICLPFYDRGLTNYESLEEAVRAAGTGNTWVAVLDGYETEAEHPEGNLGYDAYIREINDDGYELEYKGSFSFDRYKYSMYLLK
jgi:uncharacterized membrane protein